MCSNEYTLPQGMAALNVSLETYNGRASPGWGISGDIVHDELDVTVVLGVPQLRACDVLQAWQLRSLCLFSGLTGSPRTLSGATLRTCWP